MQEHTLAGLPHPDALNPALVRWRERHLFIYRTGAWESSTLYLGELDGRLRPLGKFRRLEPLGGTAAYEDPRFFTWRDELWFSFGVHRNRRSAVGIARLTDDLQVRDARVLKYDASQATEKNWIFFPHEGELYCTYAMMGGIHHVLRVTEAGCEHAFVTQYRDPWSWGQARGGTPLVERAGLWYGIFHGTAIRHEGDHNRYFMGAYAVEPRPPFRIVKMSAAPLYTPPKPRIIPAEKRHQEMKISVIFPTGLLAAEGGWRIAAGHNDNAIKIFSLAQEELDANLVATEIDGQSADDPHIRTPRRSLVHFPGQDPHWSRIAEVLQLARLSREKISGPERFANYFDDFIPCSALDMKTFADIRWLILHKDRVGELKPAVMKQVRPRFVPYYADDVFVILTDKTVLPRRYEFDPNHDRALWIIIENLTLEAERKRRNPFLRLKWW